MVSSPAMQISFKLISLILSLIISSACYSQTLQLGVSSSLRWYSLSSVAVADSNGKTSFSNINGSVDISGMNRPLWILLDRGHFQYENLETGVYAQLSDLDSLGGRVALNRYFDTKHLVAWHALEMVREKVLSTLPSLQNISWFDHQQKVDLKYSDGCNAVWDGTALSFFTGDSTCQASSLIPDLAIHEYGHALLERISRRPVADGQDYSEGFSDSLMAILGHDPLFGEGLYTQRINSHIRDLRYLVTYPDGWRGVYSGSLIFSGVVWSVFSRLEKLLGAEQAEQICLKALLLSARNLAQDARPQIVEAAKLFNRYVGSSLQEIGKGELNCIGDSELAIRNIQVATATSCAYGRLADLDHTQLTSLNALASGSYPKSIEDNKKVKIHFLITKSGKQLSKAVVHLDVEHFFPDDVVINYEYKNKTYHLYKGIEELPIPSQLEIPLEHIGPGQFSISIEDHGNSFDGQLRRAPVLDLYWH